MENLKIKYYKVKTSLPIDSFLFKLNSNQYSEEQIIGFDTNSYYKNKISSKFIEKKIIKEIVINPFGEKTEISNINYIYFDFELIFLENIVILKTVSAPRSIKSFIKKLSSIASRDFSFSEIFLDIESFYQKIVSREDIARYNVKKVNITSIPFSENSTGKIEISSTKNALDEFLNINTFSKYKIEKLKLNFRYKDQNSFIEFNHRCSFNLSSNCEELFDNLIQNDVITLM